MSKPTDSDGDSIIPTSEKDITDEWIQKVVGMTPLPNSTTFEGNIQDGIGFLSYMCRVAFQTKEHGMQHILVKMLPHSDEWKEMAVSGNVDVREIQFYEKVKPRLIEMDPSLEENMCTFYCGKYSDRSGSGNTASMLVMEDLRPLGYQMCNPQSELWEENLSKVINCLARFHCASAKLEQSTNSKIPELFPFCFGIGDADQQTWLGYAKANAEKLGAFLEQRNNSPEVRAAYRDMPSVIEPYFWTMLKETAKSPCLIHSDLWYPNIMVKEGAGSDAPVKFIDFQLIGYRNPVAELGPTILACIPLEKLKRENLDKFCKLYYETCVSLGNNLGKSYLEFQECFNAWGLTYAFVWYLLAIGTTDVIEKRVSAIMELLHNEYKIPELLKNSCKK